MFPRLSLYVPESSNFFQEAKTVGASLDELVDILGRMDRIFQQLKPSIEVPRDKTQELLLAILSILTSVTENMTQGRASKFILDGYIVIYSPLIRKTFEKVDREGCRRACISTPKKFDNRECPDGDCSGGLEYRSWRY